MRDSTILTERTYRGHLDMAVEALSDENAEQAARIADLESDGAWLRELLAVAVDRLHDAHVAALERQRRINRLLDELRALRAPQRRTMQATCTLPDRVSGKDSRRRQRPIDRSDGDAARPGPAC